MSRQRKPIGKQFARLILATLALPGAAWPQTAPDKIGAATSYEVDVAGSKEWVETNIDVRGGAKLRFTAKGTITYPPDESYSGKTRTLGRFGPDGLPRGFADLLHQYPVVTAGHGALIGRVGDAA